MAEIDTLIEQLEEAGHHVEVTDHVRVSFESQVKKPYLELLQKNLHDRFPAVEIVTASHILDPKQLPEDEYEYELYQYGLSDLDFLLEHYTSSPVPDPGVVPRVPGHHPKLLTLASSFCSSLIL